MAHLTAAAHRLLAAHHGVASTTELVACGMTASTIKRVVREGGLELVLQGAYRTPSRHLDDLARCVAVSVAHPDAVVSGPTAGRLWGFRRMPPDRRVHIIAPPRSHPTRMQWVVPYRTAAIHDLDVIDRDDGIRMTSRPRTAFDLARTLSPLDLRSVIEQAMHDGGHDADEMRAVAADWISPRRAWAARFVEQLDRRIDGGAAESHPEVVLADALIRAGLSGLVRQHPVDLPGYGRARFDLAVPSLRWAIEIDVHPSHRDSAGVVADSRRDAAASNARWLVTRVPNTAFGSRLDDTVAHLLQVRRVRTGVCG